MAYLILITRHSSINMVDPDTEVAVGSQLLELGMLVPPI